MSGCMGHYMVESLKTAVFETLPSSLAYAVADSWAATANRRARKGRDAAWGDVAGLRLANGMALDALAAAESLPRGLDFESGHEDVAAKAVDLARRFQEKELLGLSWRQMLDAAGALGLDVDVVLARPVELIRRGVRLGDAALVARGIQGVKGRLKDQKWWRPQLYRFIYRRYELVQRNAGMIHRKAALYVSHSALGRFRQRKAQAREFFAGVTAVCEETGESFQLEELWAHSLANPKIRRMELMTRMRGFDEISRVHGHYGCMVTLTCPSRFHKKLSATGLDNPKYDGSSPREAADYLQSVWAKIRAALGNAGIRVYGFRVAEPHHDATPHWHLLLFMEPEHKWAFRRIVAKLGCREDREELGLRYFLTDKARSAEARRRQEVILRESGKRVSLRELKAAMVTEAAFWADYSFRFWKETKMKARVDFVDIDPAKGSAAAYLSKYVSKNIDGLTNSGVGMGDDDEAEAGTSAVETAERVCAWASLHGVRQFQQIGGVPVTLYRELRRVHTEQEDSVLHLACRAADEGDWGKFVALVGGEDGAFVRRADVKLALYKEEVEGCNQYGEEKPDVLRGVIERETGEYLVSREKSWVLRHGGEAAAWTWTCVNNCTILSEADWAAVSDGLRAYNPSTPEEIEQTLAACEAVEDVLSIFDLPDETLDFNLFGFEGEEELAERLNGRLRRSQQVELLAQAEADALGMREKSESLWAYRDYMRRLDGLRLGKPLMSSGNVDELKPVRVPRYLPRPKRWTVDEVLAGARASLAEVDVLLADLD